MAGCSYKSHHSRASCFQKKGKGCADHREQSLSSARGTSLSELAQGGGCAPLRAELLICLHGTCPQHRWPALASLSTGNSAKQSPAIMHTGTAGRRGRGFPGRIPVRNSSWALGAPGQPIGPCNGLSVVMGMVAGGDASQEDASQACSAHCPRAPRPPNPGAQGKGLAVGRRFSQLQQADREGGG